jgi:transposase-like protein
MALKRYKKTDLFKAIENSGGNISLIARRLGCLRSTVYKYLDRYPDLGIQIEQEREAMLDMAENELLRQIKDGNTTAVIFYLKTQGRSRGYDERMRVEHSWKREVVQLVRSGRATIADVKEELGEELALELFGNALT